MVKAIGVGFGLLLFWVALHTLPVQWVLTILILSGAVTLALLPKPERDPRRWLSEEDEDDDIEPVVWTHRRHPMTERERQLYRDMTNAYQSPWTLDDEIAMAADRDYDEERSE